MSRRALFALALLPLLGSVDAAADEPEAPLRYVVRADAGLETLRVQVCFDGALPRTLVPGVEAAAAALVEARDARGRLLPSPRGRIDLSRFGAARCLTYVVDLDAALAATRFAGRYGEDLLLSAGIWLWRPARPAAGGATLRFELPPGVQVAAPWPVHDGVHRLSTSVFQQPTFFAIGRFTPSSLRRHGVALTAVRLGEGWSLERDAFERWLARAIDGVTTVQGRFPVERLLVVLVPSEGAGVDFGMVRRGGGPSIAFMVGRAATAEALERSWIPWHELSHLHLPPMRQRDAWLYEGLATYYQEVLRARVGVQSAEQAWEELIDGLRRGARMRGSGLALEAEAEAMRRTFAFQRVYWAGAAFALHADVALRMRGSSLDRTLACASRHWRGSDRVWTSVELATCLDRCHGERLLRPMSEAWASRVRPPDVMRLLRRLGVPGGDNAELEGIRDAIMQPP